MLREVVIYRDEVTINPSEAQALHRSSRIPTVLKRYEFFKSK